MSSLLGGASGQNGVNVGQAPDDIRLWAEAYDHDGVLVDVPVDDQWVLDGWRTGWWPGSVGMDASGGEMLAPIWWDRPEMTKGHNSRLGFAGTTRTVYGSAVPGAVVKLFRTVDDSIQDTRTSDAFGAYIVSTPFNDAHYIVVYKDDVIDLAGATVNTLIPA